MSERDVGYSVAVEVDDIRLVCHAERRLNQRRRRAEIAFAVIGENVKAGGCRGDDETWAIAGIPP